MINVNSVLLFSLNIMGALALYIFNELKKTLEKVALKVDNHLEDKTLHTRCQVVH